MNEEQLQALEEVLRKKKENEEKISIKDVTSILYPPTSPENNTANQT